MRNENEKETNEVDLPVKRNMKIRLKSTEPSGYPVAMLKEQMTMLGLGCNETTLEQLEDYKKQVLRDFPKGKREAFGIYRGKLNPAVTQKNWLTSARKKLNEEELFAAMGLRATDVNGSWVVEDDAAGYRTDLCRIVYTPNFDKLLKEHAGEFAGAKSEKSEVINEPTGKAIRDSFKDIALAVSGVVMSGIKKEDLESIVSCIILENQSENINDYEIENTVEVFLVNGYDEEMESAVAVGVLSIEYKIHIENYQDKSDNKDGRYNDAQITATARFISYSDMEVMERDLGYLDGKKEMGVMIPVPTKKVQVYDKRPAASKEVFQTGVPVKSSGQCADTLIFFSPDLENIGYIDNTQSAVTTTYSRSVAVGFSHTSQMGISSEVSMELDCKIVKFGVKMGVSMTISDEWNQSQEETVSFEVAAGKEAYLYQGKLRSIILRYDPAENIYKYLEDTLNMFSTTSIKTTKVPVTE